MVFLLKTKVRSTTWRALLTLIRSHFLKSDRSLPDREGGGRVCFLLTQTQSLDDSTVAVDVAGLQIVEECATLTYETSERTLGAVVLAILLHVLSEVSNAVGEQCNLALSATGVGSALTELLEEFGLLSGI